jgi:hypothetical protein
LLNLPSSSLSLICDRFQLYNSMKFQHPLNAKLKCSLYI